MLPVMVSGAVEGPTDEAVLRRLIEHVGASVGTIFGKNGKSDLLPKLGAYNNAAKYSHWVVLVDLDMDTDCAPEFKKKHLPTPANLMCFRIAVREIESWLMADRSGLSHFLSIVPARIPHSPDFENDPKRIMVDLARQSNKRDIREDMVPFQGSSLKIGAAYASRLIEFIQIWNIEAASKTSESLKRALDCLDRLVQIPSNS